MLKSISFKKLAVLSAGFAIVLSSCGLQNSASESSGTETAAGKTKNSALGEWCYRDEAGTPMDLDEPIDWGITKRQWADNNNARYRWQDNKTWITDVYGPDIVPCSWTNYGMDKPVDVALFDEGNAVGVSGPPANPAVCVKPDIKQKLIDGYTEQLARPLGGEVTEAYLAIMQKGLDVSNAMCTN
jgi:hypothetical protein